MSFASAFLGQPPAPTIEQKIAHQLEVLLQSVSPEQQVGPELPNVQASNLCYGMPMNWAVGDGARNTMIRVALQQRLARFEPRITLLSDIEIQSDDQENAVSFFISATVATEGGSQTIGIEKTISRMDQHVQQEM